MKQKLSITLEEDIVKLIEKYVSNGNFRNKSHAIEYSVTKVIKEQKHG
jgi:Arc/MetJ-type ribon-helix-helix transcriptional regulator